MLDIHTVYTVLHMYYYSITLHITLTYYNTHLEIYCMLYIVINGTMCVLKISTCSPTCYVSPAVPVDKCLCTE